MRFMVMVKATEESEAGVLPSDELLEAMGSYNEELVKAGVHARRRGPARRARRARACASTATSATVIDGPFTETKELVAGFWIWQVQVAGGGDRVGQALPEPDGGDSEIEIRQVFEAEDFGEAFTPELREQEERCAQAAAAAGA